MKLTVVFANTHRTYMAITHENESFPYTFRTVRIELTEEQVKKLERKVVGVIGETDRKEEIFNSWLED